MKGRKVLVVLAITLMVLALVLAGCGGGSGKSSTGGAGSPSGGDSKPAKHETVQHVTASGPSGSGWYPMSVLFSDIWMSSTPWLNVTVIEGGAVGNLKTVNAGANAQSGLTFASDFADAVAGRGAFEGNKLENIQAIGALYPTWWNWVTSEKSPYTTLEDFIQKKGHIVPGKPGDASEQVTRRIFELFGYDYDKFTKEGGKVSLASYGDGANMVRDGIADVAAGGGSPNVIAFSEVDATKPIKLLPLTEETLKKLDAKGYGYAIDMKIPAGTYKNQKEDVPTVATMGILFVNKSVSEEVVYELTKALWENVDRIKKEQPARGKWFDVSRGYNGIVEPEKNIHPGALKYYKEVGVAK
ncbi:hypothetical protein SY88_15810 [Clostridiales bacterium PH28_bin88]|nr:hypothetical protein SY88_15810 [Clostridiales bacterium PH28_bin88]